MKRFFAVLLLISFLAACSPKNSIPTPTVTSVPTLPGPLVQTTRAPEVQQVVKTYLETWKTEDYSAMYAMLTRLSRDAITEEKFTAYYKDVAVNLTLKSIDYEVLSTLTNPTQAQAAFAVKYHTNMFGDMQREMTMGLALEEGGWKVQWEDAIVLPELKGGNHLALDFTVPRRGNIYDRLEKDIAAETEVVSLGFIPEQTLSSQAGVLISLLADLVNKPISQIQKIYNDSFVTPAQYVGVGETTQSAVDNRYRVLSGLSGLIMKSYTSRYYVDGGIAPQVIGYTLYISPDQMEEYRRKGYRGDERVGMAGLEKWAEDSLAGQRGATLYVVDTQGQVVTRLGQIDSEAAHNVYTTLDEVFQERVQRSLAGFRGAVVVLERDTGRVLAMASSPTYNPNLFDPSNANNFQITDILNDQDKPLVNRAAQGGYPLGSVFKVITMAAALESGLYTPTSSYDCEYEFTELPGLTLYDWTYEEGYKPSGRLNLPDGLMRSCNPWFWHIGLDLYRQNQPTRLPELARAFGLGSATGVDHFAEDAGNVEDPINEGDAVQMAIGQGTIMVTPLQVVNFIAAIGNGGTLYRPQIIEKITTLDGTPTFEFKPEVRSTLPIKADTLSEVQKAMRSVVDNPKGTAHGPLLGLDVKVYGKTGSAQNPFGDAHSWFAGYTDDARKDKPNIAVVVIAENAGEGFEVAAPIWRRVIEMYYFERPMTIYPWESSYFVTRTPTPLPTATPYPVTPSPILTETPES